MNGELSQIIELAVIFNSGQFDDISSIGNGGKYYNPLSFISFKKKFFGGYKEIKIGSNSKEWFLHLKNNECQRVNLVYESDNSQAADHMLAGFVGGGGSWFLEAEYKNHSDFWRAKWEVIPEVKRENGIVWDITYALLGPKRSKFKHPIYNIDTQKEALGSVLNKIAKLTDVEEYLSNWGKIFREAKTMLEAPISKENYLSYLQGYISNEDYIKLLSAGAKSSVFGGMGSWNDIGGFDKEEHSKLYDELSVEIYSELNNSFLTAVNFRG